MYIFVISICIYLLKRLLAIKILFIIFIGPPRWQRAGSKIRGQGRGRGHGRGRGGRGLYRGRGRGGGRGQERNTIINYYYYY